jgi:hypothetical protein
MLTVSALTAAFIGVVATIALVIAMLSLLRAVMFLVRIAPGLRASSVDAAMKRRGERLAIRGKVTPVDTITSPYTSREGVYLKATVETYRASTTALPSGGGWHASNHVEEAAPFELRGQSDAMLVDPEGGQFLVGSTRKTIEPRAVMVTEALVEPEQELIAIGRIADEEGFDPSEGYRGTTVRPVMSAGKQGLLVATPWELLRDVWRRIAFPSIAAVLSLTAIVGVLVFFGNRYPFMTYDLPGEQVIRANRDTERYPGAVHLWWSRLPRGAEVIGEARVEIWVLGGVVDPDRFRWLVGRGAESLAFSRACDEFWSHQLNGMAPYREETRREYLVFEVITWSGSAFRDPSVWQGVCRRTPWYCPQEQ